MTTPKKRSGMQRQVAAPKKAVQKSESEPKSEKHYGDPRQEAFEWIFSGLGFDPEHIQLNKSTFETFFKRLLPGKVITIVESPTFWVSTDTGTLVAPDLDVPKKFLEVKTRRINSLNDFDAPLQIGGGFKSKYIYVYSVLTGIIGSETNTWELRFAEFNPGKKTVTFTIDEDVYEQFLEISDRMAINKSKFVENRIREFISKI